MIMTFWLLLLIVVAPFVCPAAELVPPTRTLSASGKVVDAKGKPVVGATVYLREWVPLRKQRPYDEQPPSDILATTRTDRHGEFAFREIPLPKPYLDEFARSSPYPWDVVVTASGYDVGWQALTSLSDRRPVTVTLQPASSIQGRVLDKSGQPVTGATVRAVRVQGLDQPVQAVPTTPVNLNLEGSRLPLACTSDAEGQFELPGLPADMRVGLRISQPHFAQRLIYAATTSKPQPNVVVSRSRAPDGSIRPREEPVYTGTITITLQLGHRLRVRTLCDDTGKPAVGARLHQLQGPSPFPANPTADNNGQLEVTQLRAGRHTLSIAPPAHSDYLGVTAPIVIPDDKPEVSIVIRLPRGSIASGKVVDMETGKGVPDVPLVHQPTSANLTGNQAFAVPIRSGSDGQYRMVVPRDRGVLRIGAEVPGYLLTDLFPTPKREAEGRLMHRIDVQPGRELADLTFTLDRGLVVDLHVRDIAGNSVPGAEVAGVHTNKDGRATVSGLDLRKKQDLFIAHFERQLAARVAVVPPKNGTTVNLDVRLQPTASVVGRVVDQDHKPIATATVQLLRLAPGAEEKITFYSTAHAVPIAVNADGTFAIEDLVPDTQHNVTVSALGYASAFGVPFDAQPGERHTMSDIVLPRADQVIAGVVVDPRGRPVANVQVFGTPIRAGGIQQSVRINSGQVVTDKEGRFRIPGVPRGLVRLSTYLPPPPNSVDRTIRTSASMQIEAGRQDVRIVLAGPETEGPVEAKVGRPAPEFPVHRWFGAGGSISSRAFRRQDFQDKIVLLAFMDEAKPSQRLATRLREVQQKLAPEGLQVLRVYEAAHLSAEITKDTSTPIAQVTPGLLPGGYSEAYQKYGVLASPTLFLIDRAGVLRWLDPDLRDLELRLAELLKG
jgi:protocatechuate 3,4-dioxygenase beta subunit